MKRLMTMLMLTACLACGGCLQSFTGGTSGAGDDSTTREARSLLSTIFKIDGKLLGTASLTDLAPLLNAAGKAYGIPGAGDAAVRWDDQLLAALGRKVDEAQATGVDPFADVPSVDGPWTDAEGAPVKFPLRRERVKRLIETFGAPAVPTVSTVPALPAAPGTPAAPTPSAPEVPAQPEEPTPPRPSIPGIDP